MKKQMLLAVSTALLMIGGCSSPAPKNETSAATDTSATMKKEQAIVMDTTKLKAGDTFYQCEMDLDVLSDKPGSCPKCGMDLSEVKKK